MTFYKCTTYPNHLSEFIDVNSEELTASGNDNIIQFYNHCKGGEDFAVSSITACNGLLSWLNESI